MLRTSKTILSFLSALAIMLFISVVAFSQGMSVLQNQNFHPKIQQLNQNHVTDIDKKITTLFFLDYEIVHNNNAYFAVIGRDDSGNISAVKIKDIFTEVIMFSNIPLLLIVLLAFIVPYYINAKASRKINRSLRQVNEETEKLIDVFNIELAPIQLQDPIAKLNQALIEINKSVAEHLKSNEISIFQDKLTGLADRHAYLKHLQNELDDAQKFNKRQALLFIDLDGFKQVNDSFGHSFGDEVLIQVAQRLTTVVRNHGLSKTSNNANLELNLSRLGGDEFSIFIENITSDEAIIEVATNILQEIERDFVLGNKVIKIGASIGIAVYPDSAANPNALLQMADVAMYRAKTDGRGIFRVYSPEMGSKIRRYHYLLEEMRLAIASQNFKLSFQPIVKVNDFSIDYFECLIRWHHPVEGNISPAEFIPIAEESNLILELGNWILFEACRQMSAWYNAGMNKVRISINISGVQLKHLDLHQLLMDTLEKVDLPTTAILLEITESCFIDASEKVINNLQRLRDDGVLIAIDDFGTGFSSLSTLANLPVDVIKIDKLFIDQANINPKYQKILNSISDLGKQLDLKIVAEGVETASQFELVKNLGIHCVQGYLIARPETSHHVGANVISKNLNQLAQTGTSVCLPSEQ
ncbi:putative bifunctional diguanylate cyclase/phosphodiesterase [Shewanella maritima]|uniref:putative bifunctional diguanylate cyclase/phosphodiesterase n=1 Tax=Shewanella maritima TaxID=2520507 RepID=UPI003735DE92